jgi:hypothetical protein
LIFSDFTDTFQARLNRTDCTDAMAQYFISSGQTRLSRVLRVPAMEAFCDSLPVLQTVTNPVTQEVMTITGITQVAIPDDFLAWKTVIGDGRVLRLGTEREIMGEWGFYLGIPRIYARIGGNLYIKPFAQYLVRCVYYAQYPALVQPTDSNYLTDGAVEALMFASLAYAGDHFRMDETETWDQRCNAEVAALNAQGQDSDTTGGPMAVSMVYGDDCGGYYGGNW